MGSWAQLDSGQKKSVLTTPHFVLPRHSGHAGVDCQIFCEICCFQELHTHRATVFLRCFHSTVVKGFTIQCLFVRYWNGRNKKGARMEMEIHGTPMPCCELLQVWRQVSRFPPPRVMYPHYLYTIYTLSSQWQQETADITIVFTQCYTQANYWQLTHVLAWLAALMFHDLIPHYNTLGPRMQMVVWSCCYFGFTRSLGQVNGNLESIIIMHYTISWFDTFSCLLCLYCLQWN